MNREVALQVRVSRKERQILASLAEVTGLTQSAVVRQLVHEAARRLNIHPSSQLVETSQSRQGNQ